MKETIGTVLMLVGVFLAFYFGFNLLNTCQVSIGDMTAKGEIIAIRKHAAWTRNCQVAIIDTRGDTQYRLYAWEVSQ